MMKEKGNRRKKEKPRRETVAAASAPGNVVLMYKLRGVGNLEGRGSRNRSRELGILAQFAS